MVTPMAEETERPMADHKVLVMATLLVAVAGQVVVLSEGHSAGVSTVVRVEVGAEA